MFRHPPPPGTHNRIVRATPATKRPSDQKILHHQRLLTMHPGPGKRQPPDNNPSRDPTDPTRPHRTSHRPAPKSRRRSPTTRQHGPRPAGTGRIYRHTGGQTSRSPADTHHAGVAAAHTPPGRECGANQPPAGSCLCRQLCYVHFGPTKVNQGPQQRDFGRRSPHQHGSLRGGTASRYAPICEVSRNQRNSGESATPPDNTAGHGLWFPRERGWSQGVLGRAEEHRVVPARAGVVLAAAITRPSSSSRPRTSGVDPEPHPLSAPSPGTAAREALSHGLSPEPQKAVMEHLGDADRQKPKHPPLAPMRPQRDRG